MKTIFFAHKIDFTIIFLAMIVVIPGCINPGEKILIGELSTGVNLSLQKNPDNQWGMTIANAGLSSLTQPAPVQIEFFKDSTSITKEAAGYKSVDKSEDGFTGQAVVKVNDIAFNVTDSWTLVGNALKLSRKLQVEGSATGGFLSAVTFRNEQSRDEVQYFAPGMIFGDADHLTKVAIGGHDAGDATWIREDRLPAPMFGLFFEDGSSVTMLDPAPRGQTTKEDSYDGEVTTLIDERLKFGSMGAEAKDDAMYLGFKWPGTEGETTYRGYFYPGGQVQKWRRRYHPVKNNFEQSYQVSFRFGKGEKEYANYYKNAWRWTWKTLQPQVNPQDIDQARRSLVDMLAERVETKNGLTGLYNMTTFAKAGTGTKNRHPRAKTVMGFTGKALESANSLLQDADIDSRPAAEEHRQKALDVINSFLKLKLSPPAGEGFFFKSGEPALALPRKERMYIRSFGDGLKALLKAAKREKEQGRRHDEWVAWARSFADWLLSQQSPEGAFPRAWEPVTGKVVDDSPQSSYTVIPYLLLLSELTGEAKYREAAIKAGTFCWNNGQRNGIFVGGTIDNPDVVDKEAGTLSLEAYLALYDATQDKKWLERAKTAANFAETWMYIWDVPMPVDENNEDLHWKKGVPTVGLQLISTGHSLVDAYMAFDADEFAKLAVLTGDEHYREVAVILLHNTKGMLALPGRTYDLPGSGWQQEHWSLAPERGIGRKRAWLPWVSTSHLNGIFGLMEFDPDLFEELAEMKPEKKN